MDRMPLDVVLEAIRAFVDRLGWKANEDRETNHQGLSLVRLDNLGLWSIPDRSA